MRHISHHASHADRARGPRRRPPRAVAAGSESGRSCATAVETLRTVSYQQGREEQTDRQTKTVKIGTDGELTLANIAGDIVVTRANGSEATIEIVKTARARTVEDARELLGLVTVSVTERSGRAEVKTVYPRDDEMRRNNRRNVNVSVAYTVSAPAGTRLTIGSVSGSIKVSDIKGDLSANSISGAVRHRECRPDRGGEVNLGRRRDPRHADRRRRSTCRASAAACVLRKVIARRIDVGSISGSVVVQDVQCDRVEAHTISGNVEFGGPLAKGGRYELNSHSGDVRIALGGRDRIRAGSQFLQRLRPLGPALDPSGRSRPGSFRAPRASRCLRRRQRRAQRHHLLRQRGHHQALAPHTFGRCRVLRRRHLGSRLRARDSAGPGLEPSELSEPRTSVCLSPTPLSPEP